MKTRHGRAQAGFTIVELLVVILLSSILTLGLFYLMASQQQVYRSQAATLSNQENLWGAMEYIQREVRMAGYGMGACGDTIHTAAGVGGTWKMIEVQNDYNSYKAARGLAANDGTDSLSVRLADDAGGANPTLLRLKDPLPEVSPLNRFDGPAVIGIADGDLVVFCQPGSGKWPSLVQVTQPPSWNSGTSEWTIQYAHGGSSYNPPGGHTHFPPGGYAVGTYLIRYGSADNVRHFAVDNTVSPGLLVTWEGNDVAGRQVIAEGIEDFQISWACDLDKNGMFDEGACTADTCQPADCYARSIDEWANNLPSAAPADTEPACAAVAPNGVPIGIVRITLVARTASPVQGNRTGFRPTAEDHCKGTAAEDLAASGDLGTYGRSVLTVRVQPKNISLTSP